MRIQKAEGQIFEGTQSQDRIVSALPVRIDYGSYHCHHSLRPQGRDWLISMEDTPLLDPISIQMDPYAIREAFESVDTPEHAVRFLYEAGYFWIWRHVLWSQFQEWQHFFKLLRQSYDVAAKDPLGRMAFAAASGGKYTRDCQEIRFFAMNAEEFTRTQLEADGIQNIGPRKLKEILSTDREELEHLQTFARIPGLVSRRAVLDLSWYDSTFPAPPESNARFCREARKNIPKDLYLRVSAHYVLEAIAATIYVDWVHCLKHGKCKHCGKLFKIESGHNQQFCPAPQHLKSSPCKNAHLQKVRRERLKGEET